ncbi:MAG: hypothetical protein WD628_04590 [Thermomicrobiales bacterium]
MPVPGRSTLATGFELVSRELADRLQHHKARFILVVGDRANETLVAQPDQPIQNIDRDWSVSRNDLLGYLQRPATGKHAYLAQ